MAAAATATGPRFAPEDPTLPKPWRGLVDGKTGYLYFWNPETNITQYQKPSAPPKPIEPISSPVQVQESSQGQHPGYGSNEDNERSERGNNVGSKPAVEAKIHESDRSPVVNLQNGIASGGNEVQLSLGGESGQSAESYRARHEVTVSGDNVPAPFMSFESTGFPPDLLREGAIFALG